MGAHKYGVPPFLVFAQFANKVLQSTWIIAHAVGEFSPIPVCLKIQVFVQALGEKDVGYFIDQFVKQSGVFIYHRERQGADPLQAPTSP